MAIYYDISDWVEKPFLQTKGTRNKCVVVNPLDNSDYYFKTSYKKDYRYYKPEFWSEIIASEIGRSLGFEVLEYDIARKKEEVGCISKSMIQGDESLTEGHSLLSAYNRNYNPENTDHYKYYTFNFIRETLKFHNWEDDIKSIISTIIFDCIIGNSDRHQSNWGFITVPVLNKDANSFFKRVASRIKSRSIDNEILSRFITLQGRYSPIYDSGCCLAREHDENWIKKTLSSKIMFDAFINRGKSEIRWREDGDKLNHFDLVKKIKSEHKNEVESIIKEVFNRYREDNISKIIFNIDKNLPENLKSENGLSIERKMFIERLIIARIKRLEQI